MARLLVCDADGRITVDIEASGSVLGAALEHKQAEPVVRCAILMALSALAVGEAWPSALLQAMSSFMTLMRQEIYDAQLS